ncbi:2-polyprenylphenol 6-hydroxylase [Yunchengibacter salinarum]|uniref:2-polyprenylphenol 6-hydroxylase n=1 Tax=Yunchengibacter salinarum TaxID=3133399 RepID=UPI0035B685B1
MGMLRDIIHIGQLVGFAITLRRHGAIRSLSHVELVPPGVPAFLRAFTFWVPRRRGLPEADGERLAAALAAMGPAYIKMGQTLATRPDLVGQPLARGLATLQDRLPPFPFAAAKATMEQELDAPLDALFRHVSQTPVAAASIAQVHKAETVEGRAVAVKVLRPGIEERFQRDVALFEWLAELADRHVPAAARLRPKEVVTKIRQTVEAEMDLRLEAAAAGELADNMAGEAGYRIPEIQWHHTARRVLVLEWVDGIRLSDRDALEASGHDLTRLARTLVQVFLKQSMRDGYFHADLHPGNLLVEPDGTIVAIDFGIMGRLNDRDRRFLAEILYGFIRQDYRRVAEIHFDAGYVPDDQDVEAFAQAMRSIADPIMDLPVERISAGRLLAQLFATTERFAMQTQPQLLLLQRSMVMAEGLALHLDPSTNMWQTSRPIIEAWMLDNLSPEARLADFLNRLPRLVERLPDRLERLLEDRPNPPPPQPVVIRQGRGLPLLAGMALGALIALLVGL